MISCKETTILIEKKHGEEIDKMDVIQLSEHLKTCKTCSLYAKQAEIIERLLKWKPELPSIEIEKLKERIKKKLDS